MKDTIVVFKDTGARIYTGADPKDFQHIEEPWLLNPELPKGIPPHRWQLEDGRITVGPEKVMLHEDHRLKSWEITDSHRIEMQTIVRDEAQRVMWVWLIPIAGVVAVGTVIADIAVHLLTK